MLYHVREELEPWQLALAVGLIVKVYDYTEAFHYLASAFYQAILKPVRLVKVTK